MKLKALLSALDLSGSVGLIIASSSLLLILFVITAELILRRFGTTTYVADTLSGFLLASLAFTAQAYTLKRNGHIRIDMVIGHLPHNVQAYLHMFACSLSTLFLVYFCWYAVKLIQTSYNFGQAHQGTVAFPMWIPQLFMAIGAFLFILQFIARIIRISTRSAELRDNSMSISKK